MTETGSTSHPAHRAVSAANIALLVLTGVMFLSLTSRTPPHPPIQVPLFGLGPYLGASLAIGAAALMTGGTRLGTGLTGLFVLTALVSFGPQKYLDPNFPLIWPAVITAQVAIATAAVGAAKLWRAGSAPGLSD